MTPQLFLSLVTRQRCHSRIGVITLIPPCCSLVRLERLLDISHGLLVVSSQLLLLTSGAPEVTLCAVAIDRNVEAPGGGGYFPAACIRSARLTPAALTRMSTSPGAGETSGTDSQVRRPERATIACIPATYYAAKTSEILPTSYAAVPLL